MCHPWAVSLIYHESCALAFFITIVLCLIPGVILVRKQPKNKVFYAREGSVTVALSWIVMSIMGSIPFLLSGSITNPVDALFETVSGFTTTGASILPAVEPLQHGVLFWRSFTHWIGGMGVLVFLLCLLPLTGNGYHMNLMKAESPGPSVTKLVPKVQSTAKILYGLYLFLTVMEFVLLLVGQMPVFDSLCTAFGTAEPEVSDIKNDSFGSYSTYLQGVVTVFMILFGINFNVYFLFYMKKPKEAAALRGGAMVPRDHCRVDPRHHVFCPGFLRQPVPRVSPCRVSLLPSSRPPASPPWTLTPGRQSRKQSWCS